MRGVLAVASAGAMVAALAACGSDDGGTSDKTGSSDTGKSWILGTTDTITAMDPAGSYDFGSWNMQYSIFQQLMTIPANGADAIPDAATCKYTDPKTVSCALTAGLKFSNGDDLTSSDVKFSFERNITIADPNGASILFGQLMAAKKKDTDPQVMKPDAIETPDATTVIFHLNTPDTTFLKYLTTAAASIVDEDVFPADKLLADDAVIGSGPYTLAQYKAGEQAVLSTNKSYDGDRASKSSEIFIQFFKDPSTLKTAIETKKVDVAWRTLSPTDLNDLKTKDGVQVIQGGGSEFRYWVFQLANAPVKDVAVRQAAAQVIDRDAIAKDAYDGTVTPAYSIVPPGFGGQKDSFKDAYGATPDIAAAKQTLADAGISTPVTLKLGYTPTHYGPNTVDEANEFASELNDSGLFKVSIDDAEWEEYQTLYKQGAYDLFILGWYPDILDADNYLTPFIHDGGFFANHYSNPDAETLLTKELGETDQTAREGVFGQLQDIVAKDVPLIPSWNGQNVAVATDDMEGVADTLDPTYIFRYWLVDKK